MDCCPLCKHRNDCSGPSASVAVLAVPRSSSLQAQKPNASQDGNGRARHLYGIKSGCEYSCMRRLTRIVGHVSDHIVTHRPHHERISTHWNCWKRVLLARIVETSIWRGPVHGLKIMSVQVEWVLSTIVVVEYQLNHIAFLENEGVGVLAVNGCISGIRSGR